MRTEDAVRQELDKELNWLTFRGQEAVMDKLRQPVRHLSKRRVAFALVLSLVLLCATAVALVMRFTPSFDADRSARDAVTVKYGLTDDMLDLFYPKTEKTDTGWRVILTPASLDVARIGVYDVALETGRAAEATWSHDGADLMDGSLAAEAWGPVQLEKVMTARKKNNESWTGDFYEHFDALTLEEKAALDADLLLGDGTASGLVYIAPKEGDIAPEQAEMLARQAIHNKYGIDGDSLSRQSINFYYFDAEYAESWFEQQTPLRVYRFDFILNGSEGSFIVRVDSPSGEVLRCVKQVKPEDDFLPEDDLSAYPDAVREWVENGSFACLTADEKADAVRRFTMADMRELLPEGDFLPTSSVRVTELEALGTAKLSLGESYQLTAERLVPFSCVTSLQRVEGAAVWQFTWTWNEMWRTNDHPNLPMERLGSYNVRISAEDGSVISCAWSLDGETQTDLLGTSKAWGAALIDRLYTLQDSYIAILQPYREAEPDAAWNIGDLSMEDDAAACKLMVAEGFSQRENCYVLPESGDLTYEQAVTQARQAIAEVYPHLNLYTLPLLDSMTDCIIRYEDGQAPVRCWVVTFDDGWDRYTVELDAQSGITRGIWHDSASSGNG